jgi:ATP-binding protein involved in chromosome partitioning
MLLLVTGRCDRPVEILVAGVSGANGTRHRPRAVHRLPSTGPGGTPTTIAAVTRTDPPGVDGPTPADGPTPTEDEIRAALRNVMDPELGADIVELGMVTRVRVDGPAIGVEVALTIAGCPLRAQIQRDVDLHVGALPGVGTVTVTTGVMDEEQKRSVMARARLNARQDPPKTDVPDSARVVAIASGKGGVGKSSVTVNLAVALARRGLTVGVLDADIWGFSVPRLLGMQGDVEARDKKMVPLERSIGTGTLRVLSMGFLADEEHAIMWRGLVLNRAVQQFLEDVHWGDLDFLLIDMPPGTGDIQMGLARMMPRAEVVVVTTPPVAAQKVAARTADMARKGYLRVTGVVENMSDFTCEHGTTYALFGSGGGARLAAEVGVPLLGQVPLHPSVSAGGDAGVPVALDDDQPLAAEFARLADALVANPPPVVSMDGCSARMLERVEAAVAAGEPA